MTLIKELKKYKKIRNIFNFSLTINSYLLTFSFFTFTILAAIKITNIFKTDIRVVNMDYISIGFNVSLYVLLFSIITLLISIYYTRKSEYRFKEVIDTHSINELTKEEQNIFLELLNEKFVSTINISFIISNFNNFNFENQKKLIKIPTLFNCLCLNKDKIIYQNYENFIKRIHEESIEDLYESITLVFYEEKNAELIEIKERLFKIYDKKNRLKTIDNVIENISYLELINYLRTKKIENIISWKHMINNHNTTHIENKIFNLEKSGNISSEITYFKFVLNIFKEMNLESQLESLQSQEFIKYIKDEITFLDNKYTIKEVYKDYFKEISEIIKAKNLNEYNVHIIDLFSEIEDNTIESIKDKEKLIKEKEINIIQI